MELGTTVERVVVPDVVKGVKVTGSASAFGHKP